MSDLFLDKGIKPMLIGVEQDAFDSPDYLYELKLDGERCIAYLDTTGTDLRNKRNIKMLPKVPELTAIHKQVRCRCILDGELAIIHNGKPDFFLIQRRSMMTNPLKIQTDSQLHPACFTAFDILYYDDHSVTDLPLTERKELLHKVISTESSLLAISRYIENNGTAFYRLAFTEDLFRRRFHQLKAHQHNEQGYDKARNVFNAPMSEGVIGIGLGTGKAETDEQNEG